MGVVGARFGRTAEVRSGQHARISDEVDIVAQTNNVIRCILKRLIKLLNNIVMQSGGRV